MRLFVKMQWKLVVGRGGLSLCISFYSSLLPFVTFHTNSHDVVSCGGAIEIPLRLGVYLFQCFFLCLVASESEIDQFKMVSTRWGK